MAIVLRQRWKGQRRADLQRMKRLCMSLKNWDTRVTDPPFLTAPQLIIVQSMLDNVVTPMLAATR